MYWFFNKYWYLFLHIFYLFHHLNLPFSFTTFPTIFKGADSIIWEIWCVLKNIKSNFHVWWYFFNLFFSCCHLYSIDTKNQNKIPIYKIIEGCINISTIDIFCCMKCYFILVRNIWGNFINVIIWIFFCPYLTFLNVIFQKLL